MALEVFVACSGEAGDIEFYRKEGWQGGDITTDAKHQTKTGQGGKYSFRTSTTNNALVTPPFGLTARWCHVWMQTPSNQPQCIQFTDGVASQCTVVFVPATGVVTIRRGTYTGTVLASSPLGAYNPSAGHWIAVYLEADNNGECRVYLDGVKVVSYQGDTQQRTDPGWAQCSFGLGVGGQIGTAYWDDIIITDDDGGLMTEPLPECYGQAIWPVAVDSGNLTGTPETGADRYLNVASLPWDPDSCNIAAAPGDEDIYLLGGYVDLGGTVLMASVYANALSEGLITQAELGVGNGGQISWGAPQALPSSPDTRTWSRQFSVNPSTGDPWTPSGLNSLKAGVRFAA